MSNVPAKKSSYTVVFRDGTTATYKGTLQEAIKAAEMTGKAFRSVAETGTSPEAGKAR